MLGRNVLQLIGALTGLVGVILLWSARAFQPGTRPWGFHLAQGVGIIALGVMIAIRFREGWWLTPLSVVAIAAMVTALFLAPRKAPKR